MRSIANRAKNVLFKKYKGHLTLITPLLRVICHLHAGIWQHLTANVSHSRGMVGSRQNVNGLRDLTTPLSGLFAMHGLAFATINLSSKFEFSNSTHCKDMKGDT